MENQPDIQNIKKKFKKRAYYFNLGILAVWLIYGLLTLMEPSKEVLIRYQITLFRLDLLRISILLPFLVIWLAALFGALRFDYYSHLVRNSPEGPGFKKISKSLWILLIVIIIPQFINLLPAFDSKSFTLHAFSVILINYLTIVLYITAFGYLLKAAQGLKNTVKGSESALKVQQTLSWVLVTILGVIYFIFVFHNPSRTISNDPLVFPTYYLSDWLLILTVLIPYIIIWLLGSLTIVKFNFFVKNVSGIIYQKSFVSIARGLITIISLSVLLQFISQAVSYFGHSRLGPILIFIYLILVAISLGYLLIAWGARKLSAIEEVV